MDSSTIFLIIVLVIVVLLIVTAITVIIIIITTLRREHSEDSASSSFSPPNPWLWIEINGTPVRSISLGEDNSFNVVDSEGSSLNVPFTRSSSANFPIVATSPPGAVIVPFSVLIPGGRYRKPDGSPISISEVQECQRIDNSRGDGSPSSPNYICYETSVPLQYCSKLSNPFNINDPCFNFPTSISAEKRIRFCGPSALEDDSDNLSSKQQCRQSDGSLVAEGTSEKFFDIINNDCGLPTQVIVTNAGGSTGYIFFGSSNSEAAGLVYSTQPTFNLLPIPFDIVGVKMGCSVNNGYAVKIFVPTADLYLLSPSLLSEYDQIPTWIIYNTTDTSGVFMQSSSDYTLAPASQLITLLRDVLDEMEGLTSSSPLISLRMSLGSFIFNASNTIIGVPPISMDSALSTLSELLLGPSASTAIDDSKLELIIAVSQIIASIEGKYPILASRLLLLQEFLQSIVPASLPFIDGSAIYNFTGTLADLQTLSSTRESLWKFFSNPESLVLSYDGTNPILKKVSELLNEPVHQPFSMSFRTFNVL